MSADQVALASLDDDVRVAPPSRRHSQCEPYGVEVPGVARKLPARSRPIRGIRARGPAPMPHARVRAVAHGRPREASCCTPGSPPAGPMEVALDEPAHDERMRRLQRIAYGAVASDAERAAAAARSSRRSGVSGRPSEAVADGRTDAAGAPTAPVTAPTGPHRAADRRTTRARGIRRRPPADVGDRGRDAGPARRRRRRLARRHAHDGVRARGPFDRGSPARRPPRSRSPSSTRPCRACSTPSRSRPTCRRCRSRDDGSRRPTTASSSPDPTAWPSTSRASAARCASSSSIRAGAPPPAARSDGRFPETGLWVEALRAGQPDPRHHPSRRHRGAHARRLRARPASHRRGLTQPFFPSRQASHSGTRPRS